PPPRRVAGVGRCGLDPGRQGVSQPTGRPRPSSPRPGRHDGRRVSPADLSDPLAAISLLACSVGRPGRRTARPAAPGSRVLLDADDRTRLVRTSLTYSGVPGPASHAQRGAGLAGCHRVLEAGEAPGSF